jgi:hypothetical protein
MFVVVLPMYEQGFLGRTRPLFGAVVYRKGR